jgi:hypothetical protein
VPESVNRHVIVIVSFGDNPSSSLRRSASGKTSSIISAMISGHRLAGPSRGIIEHRLRPTLGQRLTARGLRSASRV